MVGITGENVLFEGRKIAKLLARYAEAETDKAESQVFSEIAQFGTFAVEHTIQAFRQKKLAPDKAETILGKLCDDSCLEQIVPLIGESYDEVRRVAKEMIIKRWKASASKLLIEYVESPDFYFRASATELLCMFKDRSCVAPLVSKFNSTDAGTKKSIIKILSEIGDEACKKLALSALNDDSWDVRLAAVKGLGKIRAPESVDPLIERLSEKDPQMKRLAMDALGAIGDKRAAGPMIALLRDEDMLVRQKATDYIIEMADSEIVPEVINLMKDRDVNVRRCAVEVLNNMKDPRTTEALTKAIRDSDWWVRQIATESLTELKGANIVKSFIAMTRDPDENVRRCAVEFFNKVTDISAFEPLVKLLKEPDWWVREKAATALGRLKDKRAIAPLIELITDEDVKGVIPAALAEIGGDEVLGPLKEFLLDGAKQVRIEALKALEALKAAGAVENMKECLGDHDPEVRAQAVKSLKEITGKTFKAREAPGAGEAGQVVVSRGTSAEGAILTEAILVVDLCNSTEIAARYGDNFALKLTKILTDTVKPLAQKHRYQFMKSTGDGFLITFQRVSSSVLFALEVSNEIGKHNAKAEASERIDLRFAINVGETRIDAKGDRLGVATNMTFRIEGVKPEGLVPVENGMAREDMPLENRILVSENVEKEIAGMKGIEMRLVGLFELKGITGLHKVYQLVPVKE